MGNYVALLRGDLNQWFPTWGYTTLGGGALVRSGWGDEGGFGKIPGVGSGRQDAKGGGN